MFRSLLLVLFISTIYIAAKKTEHYSDAYDNMIDVDKILASDPERQQYYDCYMDTGPCVTPDAKYFKGLMGEILETNCLKCTDKQKEMFATYQGWYETNQPKEWEALVAKCHADSKKTKIASKRG